MNNRSNTSNVNRLSHKIINRALFSFDFERSSEQLRQANAMLARQLVIRTAQFKYSNSKLTEARELSAHLLDALEEERTRVARETYDQLAQSLTDLKFDVAYIKDRLNADWADRQELREKAVAVMAMIDETLETVRHIGSDVPPGILDDLGLVAALEWQAQNFHTRTGVCCAMMSNAPHIQLDCGAVTGLFRMAQEALTNVARHAQATRAHMTLTEEDGVLTLEVRDNGKGISESDQRMSKSLGLLGLAERARSLGGTAKVTGASGQGTTVTVRIPLDSRYVQATRLENAPTSEGSSRKSQNHVLF